LESFAHNIEKIKTKEEIPKSTIIVAFEMEKSKTPKRKEKTGIIWNCSKGVDIKNI
jgi:hypothetical protein